MQAQAQMERSNLRPSASRAKNKQSQLGRLTLGANSLGQLLPGSKSENEVFCEPSSGESNGAMLGL